MEYFTKAHVPFVTRSSVKILLSGCWKYSINPAGIMKEILVIVRPWQGQVDPGEGMHSQQCQEILIGHGQLGRTIYASRWQRGHL